MKLCLSCSQSFQTIGWACPNCLYAPEVKNGIPIFAPDTTEGHTELPDDEFSVLYEVEENSFWFQARNRLLIWAMEKFFSSAKNFFEVGCGTGYVLNGVSKNNSGLTLYGSELSPSGLGFAAQRVPTATLMQMDALAIPFVSEFDVIGAFDVLEHIESDELVLSQMFRATQKGGGIIISVPQHKQLWSYRDEIANHFRRYSRSELQRKMEKAGFTVVFSTSFVSLLVPAIIISRNVGQGTKKLAASELVIGGILGVFLRVIMNIEHNLIRAGIRFPVGGSLLMIGVKS